jgi:hypothetical protein
MKDGADEVLQIVCSAAGYRQQMVHTGAQIQECSGHAIHLAMPILDAVIRRGAFQYLEGGREDHCAPAVSTVPSIPTEHSRLGGPPACLAHGGVLRVGTYGKDRNFGYRGWDTSRPTITACCRPPRSRKTRIELKLGGAEVTSPQQTRRLWMTSKSLHRVYMTNERPSHKAGARIVEYCFY